MAYYNGTTTKDKSGHGNDFTVYGATFKNPGFNLDGSNDYLSATGDFFGNDEQSIVLAFKPDFEAVNGVWGTLLDTQADGRYLVYKSSSNYLMIKLGGASLNVPASNFTKCWKRGMVNTITVSAKSGDVDVYLNKQLVQESSLAWSGAAIPKILLGQTYLNTARFDGTMYHFSTYPFKLTPMQIRQITSELTNKYS